MLANLDRNKDNQLICPDCGHLQVYISYGLQLKCTFCEKIMLSRIGGLWGYKRLDEGIKAQVKYCTESNRPIL